MLSQVREREWISKRNLIQVAENEFEIDEIKVRRGIYFATDMINIVVLKAAHHLMRKQISYYTIFQEGTWAINEGEKKVKPGEWNQLLYRLLTIEWYSALGIP